MMNESKSKLSKTVAIIFAVICLLPVATLLVLCWAPFVGMIAIIWVAVFLFTLLPSLAFALFAWANAKDNPTLKSCLHEAFQISKYTADGLIEDCKDES